MKSVISVVPILLAAALTTASAYTLTGTVKDEAGTPVKDAQIKLVNAQKTAVTDKDGKFSIIDTTGTADTTTSADTASSKDSIDIEKTTSLAGSYTPGYINISSGVLEFSQSSNTPVQVSIFDLVGNQIAKQTLYGSGKVDFRQAAMTQGTYFARIRMGSIQQTVKFMSTGKYSASFRGAKSKALFKVTDNTTDTLVVTAVDYDTLSIVLATLDTNVELSLKKASTEEKFDFGYALKNEPTPSKGCGKDNTLKDYFKFTSAGIEREIYLDVPKNYDKNKPYRLVFGMHCMGGSAQNVAKNEHYYNLMDQDTESTTIFVAPHGYTDSSPWRCGDDKDHIFFDEFLTYLNENLCIDTSRVFSAGFSFGAMFSNSLAQTFQHRLRGVTVFATADQVIYLPKNAGKPIAWMGTVGLSDGTCPPSMGRSARDRILKNNGPNGTDVSNEKATEFSGNGGHVCYDYKTVDPRFPVRWCTFNGGHQWDMRDGGNGWGGGIPWASESAWQFITQF